MSGNQAPVDLAANAVGQFELARIGSVSGNTLMLGVPLKEAFRAVGGQVVLVPEYTGVSVAAGTSIVAAAWNGQTGGIVAFLANDAVTVNGAVSASATGFRGGAVVNDATAAMGCAALDYAGALGGRKGEGLDPAGFGPTRAGMGNLANGAGGGDCHNAGGGGGGNGGQGGQGGNSWDGGRAVGGLGGAKVTGSVVDRLTFGGGGGAGQENNNVGTNGGIGGGVLFVRARSLSGTGNLAASGQASATSGNDGAGGGGAGGTVYLRLRESAACGQVAARGGNGGTQSGGGNHGPGGGGGGGRVLLQAASIVCPVNVNAGIAGLSNGVAWGATPTTGTDATSVGVNPPPPPGGYAPPPAPVITGPASGATLGTAQPTYTGTASSNASVEVFVDGSAVGATTATGAGAWTLSQPAALSEGAHAVAAEATLYAAVSPRSGPVSFAVDTQAPSAPTITTPVDGTLTANRTPTIAGAAEANAEVTVVVDSLAPLVTSAAASGNFSVASAPLADGPHTATATARDATGNVGPASAPIGFTVDSTAPGPPSITAPANGSATNDPTPAIAGTAEPTALLAIPIDSLPALSATADGAGAFSATSPALGDGQHSVTATATDAAGNTGAPSATVRFTVDTVAPPPPVVTTPPDGSITRNRSPRIAGSAEANAWVSVFVDALPPILAPADASGVFSVQGPSLSDGLHSARGTARDPTGNESAPGAPVGFTVDTTPPPSPVIDTPAEGATTGPRPTIAGTTAAGTTVTVQVDAMPPAAAPVVADRFSYSPIADLSPGPHAAVAMATDAAQNPGLPSARRRTRACRARGAVSRSARRWTRGRPTGVLARMPA